MQMKMNWTKVVGATVAAISALSVGSTALAQSQTVYNNSTTKTGQDYAPGVGTEFGNEVSLAGGKTYQLTSFALEYNAPASAGTATINFYANNGAPFNGIANSAMPGTALGSITATGLPATGTGGETFTVTPSTTITLPSTFTWTVSFSGGSALAVGLDTYGPPTVGQSFNDIWQKSGSTWNLISTVNGVTTATFGAQIGAIPTVIPEPTTMAMGLMGVMALGGMMISKRKNA